MKRRSSSVSLFGPLALFVACSGAVGWAQSTGPTSTQGKCNASNSGDNSTVTVTCFNVDKKLADQIGLLVANSSRDETTLKNISDGITAILRGIEPADPVVHIEPERGNIPLRADGRGYDLKIVSTGVDIESVLVYEDYFWAEKDPEIKIKRIVRVIACCDQSIPPFGGGKSIPLGFGRISGLYDQLTKTGHPGLPGIRLIVAFRRSSDKKDFRIVRAYGIWGDTLTIPMDSDIPGGPFGQGLSLADILPYMNSNDHWVGMTLRAGGPEGITEGSPPGPAKQ
jgi:hypothetical protein